MESQSIEMFYYESRASELMRDNRTGKILLENLKSHSIETFRHSVQVASIAEYIAKKMKIDSDERRIIAMGALMHDIGKLSLPKKVLEGNEMLSIREKTGILMHPKIGYLLVRDEFHYRAQDICLHHHEKLDGSGYPDRISCIHLFCQIVTVADMYNAMTSQRSYKITHTHNEALIILNEDVSNGKLNSEIVKILDDWNKDKSNPNSFIGTSGSGRAYPAIKNDTENI